jgi:alkanesulfonate monooxygenase SsuD/methylene tetrahydromethanopterin reductase-like flavin-dependent oxidoreductase (luciferase family)
MEFGINMINSNRAGSPPSTVLDQFVETAIAADELGFRSIWTTEHHFASERDYQPLGAPEDVYSTIDYDMASDPMTLLSWAAAKTQRLHVGTAVSILHWDHPIRTAERAALLDGLSHGRLELGVGRGLGFREAKLFGVPSDNAANERRYYEAIEIIRKAWTGEFFEFDGEFYKVPRLAITPQPERELPLVLGSSGNASAIWAAKNDFPYATITWPLVDMEAYKTKRREYLAAGKEAGFDVSGHLCPHFLFMYCGETDEESAEVCEHYMTQFQYINEQHYELARPHDENAVGSSAGVRTAGMSQDVSGMLKKLATQPVEYHMVGSPETCIERVRMFEEEVGANYIVLNMGYAAMPFDMHMASLRRFAEQVMPHFPSQAAVAGVTA